MKVFTLKENPVKKLPKQTTYRHLVLLGSSNFKVHNKINNDWRVHMLLGNTSLTLQPALEGVELVEFIQHVFMFFPTQATK